MVNLEDKKELKHIIQVLRDTQRALADSDAFKLQQLSDQVIHSASIYQHTDIIMITTVVYSLNKLVVRKEHFNVKGWNTFVTKFNSEIDEAISSLDKDDTEEFARHIEHAKDLLVSISPNIRGDIEEVFKKASINKAGRMYEHGLSLSKTANLLGVTQWELTEYIGEKARRDDPHLYTYDIKKRAKQALEFFS